MTTTEAAPLIHDPWPSYSTQSFEKACEENRLEKLLTEFANELVTNTSLSLETKFETGCRAICMIPPQQSEFINRIANVFSTLGFWEKADPLNWPTPPCNHILRTAQEQAIKQKNLPAALALVSKCRRIDNSLIEVALTHLPDRVLVERITSKILGSHFSYWFEELSNDHNALFFEVGCRFIKPKGKENSAILDLFTSYKEDQRSRFSEMASLLAPLYKKTAHLDLILKAVSEIDADQQAECAEAVAHLCHEGLIVSVEDIVDTFRVVADLPIGRRVALCQAAYLLNLRSVEVRRGRRMLKKHGVGWHYAWPHYKSAAFSTSEKIRDTFAHERVMSILGSVVKLETSQFSEKIAEIKHHLDASQLLNRGHLECKAVCELIETIGEGTFSPPKISQCVMEIQESEKEDVLSVYLKRFLDVPAEECPAILTLLAKFSTAERKYVSDFFRVSYCRMWGYSQLFGEGLGYRNPKKKILDVISEVPKGEVEEVLSGAKKLMSLFNDKKDHCDYIGLSLTVQKGNRCALIEKIAQMGRWKSASSSSKGLKTAIRILLLVSKFRPEEFTKEVFDVLFRFEKSFKQLFDENNAQIFRELTTLAPEHFSQLSFYYTYKAIDLLGQEGLKQAVEIAEAEGGSFDTSIVKAAIAKDGSIMERALERLHLKLENGDEKEQAYAVSMIVRLFIHDFHSDEKLVLKADALMNPESPPELAVLLLLKEEAAAKKAKGSFSWGTYSLNIF